jgi:hypothetical protein
MVDYYPFIVHEVSKLHRDTGESRREVYERAREELAAKLHQPALRLPESDVTCELRAFDAAVWRIEAKIACGQTLDTGVPASMTSQTSSDSAGSIPIIGLEVESPETTQDEVQAAQINRIKEAKSALQAGTTNADSDRQVLHAIGTALDHAVHPERSTNAIGKKQAEPQLTEANFPDPSPRDEPAESGEAILSMPQPTDVAPQEGVDFDRKSDLPPRTQPGLAVARTMLMQLTNMTLAMVICGVLFAVIYFTVNIGKWFGF